MRLRAGRRKAASRGWGPQDAGPTWDLTEVASWAAQGLTGTWVGFQAPNGTTWTFHPCPLCSPSPSRTHCPLPPFPQPTPTQWTRVWANSRRQWSTGKPSVLQSLGSQRVRHDLVTGQQAPHQPLLDHLPTFFFSNCLGSSLLCRLSLVAASRGYSSLRCVGSSLWWLLAVQQRL